MEPANDIQAAQRTYDGFIGLIKWTVPILAVLVLFIILIIS